MSSHMLLCRMSLQFTFFSIAMIVYFFRILSKNEILIPFFSYLQFSNFECQNCHLLEPSCFCQALRNFFSLTLFFVGFGCRPVWLMLSCPQNQVMPPRDLNLRMTNECTLGVHRVNKQKSKKLKTHTV